MKTGLFKQGHFGLFVQLMRDNKVFLDPLKKKKKKFKIPPIGPLWTNQYEREGGVNLPLIFVTESHGREPWLPVTTPAELRTSNSQPLLNSSFSLP